MTRFWIAIATLSAALAAACSVDETGELHVALTGWARDGRTLYRLRHAELTVTGEGATRVYSTEVDPNLYVIREPLPAGEYTLGIPDGWFLERRQVDGTFDAVPAVMTTPNPQVFAIAERQDTRVTLWFYVGDEEVPLDDGTLTVAVGIDDDIDTETPSGPVASGDDMLPGETLPSGSSLRASGTDAELLLDSDGDLVLRRSDGFVGWHSDTAGWGGTVLLMQTDGNLVLYRDDGVPVWTSGSPGYPSSYLRMENLAGLYGSATIYAPDGSSRWRQSVELQP
jgi:hypothetical protein